VSDDPLVGTWRLVSFEMRDEDGRVTHPLGGDAVGFITYTPDGHMAVQFGRADRARLAVGDWPNWIGRELVRLVTFDGEQVSLSTPPTQVGGRQQIATLAWERT
jgi:hypothetical protein